eukprot:6970955-Pyramimonas_sp.AAC.1
MQSPARRRQRHGEHRRTGTQRTGRPRTEAAAGGQCRVRHARRRGRLQSAPRSPTRLVPPRHVAPA